MLYLLLSVGVIFPSLLGIGMLFEKLLGKLWEEKLSSAFFAGCMGLSLVWAVLAFAMPINRVVEVSSLVLGLSAFIYFKIYRVLGTFITRNYLIFAPLLFVVLLFGSGYPFILDHFGYYVPSIKWIAEIGLVKGIGNLDLILGQMSLWHILQAGFSNTSDVFLRLNVVLLLGYIIYIIEKKAWVHFIFLPILLLFLQSPSTDLPVIVGSLIILNEVLNKNYNVSALFGFSVWIFSIKPTIIWLPLMVFLYAFLIRKFTYKMIIVGVGVVSVFVIKNWYCFGFPVFPVQVLDLDLSWKPNEFLLKNSAKTAILKTYDFQYSYEAIKHFSVWENVKNWIFLKGIKGVINIAFVLSLLALLLFAIKSKSRLIWLIVISIFIKSVLVLLFSAQYRFFLEVFFVVVLLIFRSWFSAKKVAFVSIIGTLGMSVFLFTPSLIVKYIPSFRLGGFIKNIELSQVVKPATYKYQQYKTFTIGNLTFNVVENYPFSFDTPLPAISPSFLELYLEAGIFPQKIGSNLKEGFVWKKLSNKDREQLQQIVNGFYINEKR
ncbi:LIC_10190 family membrane protein [Riemerella anatipestifer]|uniref:LIC_10190 family membrane protein n=1 Tax=Riemerella anatipestifer TaxID=34085 RepID=UPI0021F87311|nr:hypothetical protein [Riemerella anatipestifer]MCW0485872.1 hypothetical protein [Riemerella anatipestifer]